MEFFVDEVKDRGIWGRQNENVRINKIGEFSLKVEVYFLIPGTPGFCFGVPTGCRCFEATMNLNTLEDNGVTIIDINQEDTTEENRGTADISPLMLAGAFAGGNLFLNSLVIVIVIKIIITLMFMLSTTGVLSILLLMALTFCAVKFFQRRRFQRTVKVDVNDMYGTYDTSGEQSDYSTVQDANDYYG